MAEFFDSVIQWFNDLSLVWQLLIEFFVFPFRTTTFVFNVLATIFQFFANLVANVTFLLSALPPELTFIACFLFFGGFVVLCIKLLLEAL